MLQFNSAEGSFQFFQQIDLSEISPYDIGHYPTFLGNRFSLLLTSADATSSGGRVLRHEKRLVTLA